LSEREVLAGEAPADDINGNAICSEAIGSEVSDVVVDRDVRPMLGEDSSAIGVDLAERDCFEAGALEAKTESADA
jgi:hypothetical protein